MKKLILALLGAFGVLLISGTFASGSQPDFEFQPYKCHFSFARPLLVAGESAGNGSEFPLEGSFSDQFQKSAQVRLVRFTSLCNEADKFTNGPTGESAGGTLTVPNLSCYQARQTSAFSQRLIDVEDQFIDDTLRVRRLERLCVEAEKGFGKTGEGAGVLPSDFSLACYRVSPLERLLIFERVEVDDQFDDKDDLVLWPVSLCTVASKFFEGGADGVEAGGNGINPDLLTCYQILPQLTFEQVEVIDQFQFANVLALFSERLCVPAEKFEIP